MLVLVIQYSTVLVDGTIDKGSHRTTRDDVKKKNDTLPLQFTPKRYRISTRFRLMPRAYEGTASIKSVSSVVNKPVHGGKIIINLHYPLGKAGA